MEVVCREVFLVSRACSVVWEASLVVLCKELVVGCAVVEVCGRQSQGGAPICVRRIEVAEEKGWAVVEAMIVGLRRRTLGSSCAGASAVLGDKIVLVVDL